MTWSAALILGFLQGAAEFLPISSSGHLVLGQRVLGVSEPGILFEVLVHLATVGSVLVVYRARIRSLIAHALGGLAGRGGEAALADGRYLLMILGGNLLTALVGLSIRGRVEPLFEDVRAVSLSLLVTGAVLLASRRAASGEPHPLRWRDALLIGIVQGLAVVPGISRSGLTIVTALLLGVERGRAVEFSFLLSLPAILGTTLLEVRHGPGAGAALAPVLAAMLVAFLVGIGAIRLVIAWVRGNRFWLWSIWCFAIGLAGLFLLA